MHRFRQLEPSWLRKGQTTSLLASVMEKDEVKEDLGGILTIGWGATRRRRGRAWNGAEGTTGAVGGGGGWWWWWRWAGALVDKELGLPSCQ